VVVAQDGTANASLTVTLPGVAGRMHAIRRILFYRTAVLGVVGSAALAITTTNLPASIGWTAGNAIAIGGSITDVDESYDAGGLVSTGYGTDTTFTMPAAGLGVTWHAVVYYDVVT